MTSLSGGRAGIPVPLSGFVVAEDQTVAARLQRTCKSGRSQAEVAVRRFRAGAAHLAAAMPGPATLAHGFDRLDAALAGMLGPLHGPLRRATTAFASALAALAPLARDAAALTRGLVAGLARLVWQAPRPVKAGLMMLSIIPAGWSTLRQPAEEIPLAFTMLTPATDRSPPVDPWTYVASPLPLWNLESQDLGRSAPLYRVRANATGGRQDIMIWGEAGVRPVVARAAAAGGLVIERRGGVPPSDSLFVETARRTALVGASIGRMAQSLEMETKFGRAEIAETELEALGRSFPCQAFRLTGGPGALRINGWFCSANGRSLGRDGLGCLIDRIDLTSSGNDRELRSWFAAAERNRKACGAARSVSLKPGSEPVFARPAERGIAELRLKLAEG